jgi:hypothetical protein
MGKYKIWKRTINGRDYYYATLQRDIQANKSYRMSNALHYHGPGSYSVYNLNFNDAFECVTVEETEIVPVKRVNYNKTKGNKIVIDLSHDNYGVVSYTDDFEPGTAGATYEFHFKSSPVQTLIVGETPEGWDNAFNGSWFVPTTSEEPTEVYEPQGSSCWIEKAAPITGDEGYKIRCRYV